MTATPELNIITNDWYCGVLADSYAVDEAAPHPSRLTTMVVTYPRIIHSEFMTHRLFSRNAASSRAIPFKKMFDTVRNHPFIPHVWGRMELTQMQMLECKDTWLYALHLALEQANTLHKIGLHKSIPNRLLEPWSWITVVVSATQWSNFFAQRCHPDAEPHMQKLAYMMRDAYDASTPVRKYSSEWHIPFDPGPIEDFDLATYILEQFRMSDFEARLAIATARCARTSYLNFNSKRDILDDIRLFNKLKESGHWSPFEHCAQVNLSGTTIRSNFNSVWQQYRKLFPGECR